MKTWGSKIVNFLSNANTVAILKQKDFDDFSRIMKLIGLKTPYDSYLELKLRAANNSWFCEFNEQNDAILVEYNNGKGFCFGWNVEEAFNWFGEEPLMVCELNKELEED